MQGRNTKWLNFVEEPNVGRKTQIFYVYSSSTVPSQLLGVIRYKSTWRKYIYESGNCEYDIDCMTEVLNFLKDLMAERGVLYADNK